MKKIILLFSAIVCVGLGVARAQLTVLLNFNDTNGANPYGSLIASGNILYGMTQTGGKNAQGNIFTIHMDGTGYKDLWDFYDTGTNGETPFYGAVTMIDGKLYGMTYAGGRNLMGNVFSIDSTGANYKDLLDFNTTNGKSPCGSLVFSEGMLYGMASAGGGSGNGCVFRIDTNGSKYKDLLDFNGTNGESPYGSLTLTGGKLYGMTVFGGINYNGNIFSIDTSGNAYKDEFDFNGANGAEPYGDLVISGGKIFGMAAVGGYYTDGVIFSADTDGRNFKDIYSFNTPVGFIPLGSLLLSGNLLYGVTNRGGAHSDGVLFSVDTSGNNYTLFYQFDSIHGRNPEGTVLLSDGTLYGMTTLGGPKDVGVVFSFGTCGLLTDIHDSLSDNGTNSGLAAVTPSGGPTPYTYLWAPGGQTTDTIKNVSAGTYTCTITDANGCSKTTKVTVNSTAGINSIANLSAQIDIYPNPGDGKFNGMFSLGVSSKEQGISEMQVYNVMGQEISEFTINHSQFTIDLSNQPNGVYLYRVIAEDGSPVGQGKLVIQK